MPDDNSTSQQRSQQLLDRVGRVANLERAVYAEVGRDPDATLQALVVAVIASLAAGLGAGLSDHFWGNLVVGSLGAFLGWLAMTAIVYLLAVRMFDRGVVLGEVFRPMGFAIAPAALLVLQFPPIFGGMIVVAAILWVLATSFLAAHQAMGLSTPRAVAAIVPGWTVWMVLSLGIILSRAFGR